MSDFRSRPTFDYSGLSSLEIGRQRCDPMLRFGYDPSQAAVQTRRSLSVSDYVNVMGPMFGIGSHTDTHTLQRDLTSLHLLHQAGAFK
jgi:hypothetical protein